MLDLTQRRRAPLAILLLVLLLGGAAEAFAVKNSAAPSSRRANARKLLRIADAASLRLLRDGRGRLDRDPRARDFWEALQRMDAQIDQVGTGLKLRDLSFFKALRSGTAALAELQVTWALSGVKDAAVDQNLRTLAAAYGRLRNRYGPEWVRFQSGRPLNADEKIRFERMRTELARLAGRLGPLRDRAERTGDHATADELDLILIQVNGLASASPTLGDYLDASVATDSIRGAWYGARAAHSADEEGWAETDQVVSDIATDEGVGFVFTTDLETVEGWSFAEEETEIPVEIASADVPDGIAPGQVLDLGEPAESESGVVLYEELPAEPAEEMEPLEDIEESEDGTVFTEPVDADPAASESPAEGMEVEGMEEDLPAETVPAGEAIEEEDMEIEDLPADAAPEETVAPPPPQAPPIV